MKTAFFSLLAMAALSLTVPAEARSLQLDCKNPGDGIEAKICRSTITKNCKATAAKAVYLLESVRAGGKVKIVNVVEEQEDATYTVGFTKPGQQVEIMYTRTVYVSTGPKFCEVDSIESSSR